MRDRHAWDYSYLLATMSDFMSDMEVELANGYCKHSKGCLRSLKIARECCNRLRDDSYFSPYYSYSGPEYLKLPNGLTEVIFTRDVKLTNRHFNRLNKLREQDLFLLTNAIRKHLHKWWD